MLKEAFWSSCFYEHRKDWREEFFCWGNREVLQRRYDGKKGRKERTVLFIIK